MICKRLLATLMLLTSVFAVANSPIETFTTELIALDVASTGPGFYTSTVVESNGDQHFLYSGFFSGMFLFIQFNYLQICY